jgi:hypothetical protein
MQFSDKVEGAAYRSGVIRRYIQHLSTRQPAMPLVLSGRVFQLILTYVTKI